MTFDTENLREVPITYEQAVVVFDAVNMMREEAKKTLNDNDELIAPLRREAEATIEVCNDVANKLSVGFHFDVEEDND